MFGILVSFWDGQFSGAMLVSQSVNCRSIFQPHRLYIGQSQTWHQKFNPVKRTVASVGCVVIVVLNAFCSRWEKGAFFFGAFGNEGGDAWTHLITNDKKSRCFIRLNLIKTPPVFLVICGIQKKVGFFVNGKCFRKLHGCWICTKCCKLVIDCHCTSGKDWFLLQLVYCCFIGSMRLVYLPTFTAVVVKARGFPHW